MKVRNKFKITKTFEASLEVLADNAIDKNDRMYYIETIKFIDNVKEMEVAQLTPKQKVRLTIITQQLRKKGFIK